MSDRKELKKLVLRESYAWAEESAEYWRLHGREDVADELTAATRHLLKAYELAAGVTVVG